MTRKKRLSRLAKALLEAADDMRRAGVLDATDHRRISSRHLGEGAAAATEWINGQEIRSMRERAHLG